MSLGVARASSRVEPATVCNRNYVAAVGAAVVLVVVAIVVLLLVVAAVHLALPRSALFALTMSDYNEPSSENLNKL